MEQKTFQNIPYFQKGNDPKLLIHSGTHGDEYQIIKPVIDYVTKHENELPDFVFVPEVSPSAVKLKTRKNIYGHDINRSYFDGSDDPEAMAQLALIRQFKFDLFVSFHEDPEYDAFYMYDSGKFSDKVLSDFRQDLTSHDIKLFTGIDDPSDPDLGYSITNGYASFKWDIARYDDKFLWDHGLTEGFFKRILNVEVLTVLDIGKKVWLVEKIFEIIK